MSDGFSSTMKIGEGARIAKQTILASLLCVYRLE